MERIYRCFSVNNCYYVYDRKSNDIVRIPENIYTILNSIKTEEEFSRYEIELQPYLDKGYFEPNRMQAIKNYVTDDLDLYLNHKIEQMTLQVTQNCNLRCSYCFYGEDNYENRHHANKQMSFETAKKAIDFLLSHSRDRERIHLAFYGGEPLLEFDLIKKCVEYIEEQVEGKEITFGMTTNGTVISDEIVDFWIKHDFLIMISLDGDKNSHDTNRKFKNGAGTYDIILNNIRNMISKHPEFTKNLSFNTVITPESNYSCIKTFWDTDEVLKKTMSNITTLNNAYTNKIENQFDESYYIVNDYDNFKSLLVGCGKIKSESNSKLLYKGLSMLRVLFQVLKSGPTADNNAHPGGPCIAGAKRLFVTADGGLYPCERVSESSENMHIGDLEHGIDIEKVEKLINIGRTTDKQCRNCWAFRYCMSCAAVSDDMKGFSVEKRLARCKSIKQSTIQAFKEICLLKDFNYNFEREFQ